MTTLRDLRTFPPSAKASPKTIKSLIKIGLDEQNRYSKLVIEVSDLLKLREKQITYWENEITIHLSRMKGQKKCSCKMCLILKGKLDLLREEYDQLKNENMEAKE